MIEQAAMVRRDAVGTRKDRPRERRSAEFRHSPRAALAPASVEVRAKGEGSGMDFHGIASVTERGYEMWDWYGPYTEIVSAGAFEATLARADLDVPLVLGHDSMRRIARTTNGSLVLAEVDAGLDVLAEGLDPADADVAYIVPKIRAGLIDEMSFMFRIEDGQWSPDYTEFRINRVDIHRGDVAIVGYGANPHTSGEMRAERRPSGLLSARLALALA